MNESNLMIIIMILTMLMFVFFLSSAHVYLFISSASVVLVLLSDLTFCKSALSRFHTNKIFKTRQWNLAMIKGILAMCFTYDEALKYWFSIFASRRIDNTIPCSFPRLIGKRLACTTVEQHVHQRWFESQCI